jgi:uncharacterized protein (UPF0333 family)
MNGKSLLIAAGVTLALGIAVIYLLKRGKGAGAVRTAADRADNANDESHWSVNHAIDAGLS